ncbi:putative GNAT family acetyltransferase [Evansella vedderi]|uniref:GNAT family acetyltransferase n=1 Tax=Evansella vedderi TaxID=38282 RepID=A0ABT9ZQQ6_9BACI|nr:GNAT family N-acetyltransferase [Evansella vedderi]MDQ0253573.1 putative GNAT family acetyltransferase [Evansella vedderi]
MIHQLREKDREQLMAFVKEKPAENLFIIGDVEAFGFEEDFQDVWGDFNEEGQYRAVVLRYRENYIVYAPGKFDAASIADIIDQDNRPNKMISGISATVNKLMKHLQRKPAKTRELYYAKCESLQELEVPPVEIEKATVNDVPRLVKLYAQIPEFETRDDQGEGIARNMEEGIARCYYIEQDGEMVSTAMSTAENSMSAMVIGVCTLDGYKKRGYASACMMKLCAELLEEGKYLCLFYDNPDAGTIYKKLGFVDIGKWVMNAY